MQRPARKTHYHTTYEAIRSAALRLMDALATLSSTEKYLGISSRAFPSKAAKLHLLQLATDTEVYIFDFRNVEKLPPPVQSILTDSEIALIGYESHLDAAVLDRTFGIEARILDMRTAVTLSYERDHVAHGCLYDATKVVSGYCKTALSHEQHYFDAPNLTPVQMDYYGDVAFACRDLWKCRSTMLRTPVPDKANVDRQQFITKLSALLESKGCGQGELKQLEVLLQVFEKLVTHQ